MIRKFFKAAEQVVTKRDITNFKTAGLRETLNIEKKKKQKNKALNVLGLPLISARLFVLGKEINNIKAKQKNKKTILKTETIKKTQKEQDKVSKQLRKDQEG
jgi:uncharacterized small protein (DUF1192 family)